MSDTKIGSGGDVEIRDVSLTTFNGQTISLKDLYSEIQLFEDVFSHSLTGNITIVDTNNLIKTLPIIGEEKLKISFITPSFEEKYKIDQTFIVYKLSSIIKAAVHRQVYVLHFVTPEAFTDLNRKISKAFSGTSDTIVNRLLTNDGLNSNKPIDYESSSNTIKFVSTYWSPFKCINYAAARAQTADNYRVPNFLFFETNKKYRFLSANSLINSKPKFKYKHNEDTLRDGSKNTDRDVNAEMSRIHSFQIDESFDVIKNILNGAYSHKVWEHNLLFKTVTQKRYNYFTNFETTKHLGREPIQSSNFKISDNNLTSTTSIYPKIHNNINYDNYGDIVTKSGPLLSQLEMKKIEITVNGRSDIEVGDTIEIELSGIESIAKSEATKPIIEYFNGKYIVVAIVHLLTVKKHMMVLQIAKDSSDYKFELGKTV